MDFIMNREKTVSFSGHRTEELPRGAALSSLIINIDKTLEMLEGGGYRTFINGGCYGFDLMCAEAVLRLKERFADVRLVTAVPFKEQAANWTAADTELYKHIINASEYVNLTDERYSAGVYHKRNRYLVDNCSILVAYCAKQNGGTFYTVNYAESRHIPVINLAAVR